jgi:hypothetical protein
MVREKMSGPIHGSKPTNVTLTHADRRRPAPIYRENAAFCRRRGLCLIVVFIAPLRRMHCFECLPPGYAVAPHIVIVAWTLRITR